MVDGCKGRKSCHRAVWSRQITVYVSHSAKRRAIKLNEGVEKRSRILRSTINTLTRQDEKYINLHEMGTYMKQVKSKLAEKYVRKSHGHADLQTSITSALDTVSNTSNNGVADRAKALKDKLIVVDQTLLNTNEADQLNALEEEVQSIMRSQSNNMIKETKADGTEYYTIRYNNDIQSYAIKTLSMRVNVGDVIDLYKDVIDTRTMVPPNATSVPKYTIDDTKVIDVVPENFTLLVAKASGVADLTFMDSSNAVTSTLRITVI